MALLNVRLTEDDARLVRTLRARGIVISDLVRRAIRAAAASASPPGDSDAILTEMIAQIPLPPRRQIRSANRREAREEILTKLRKKR